MNNLKAIKLFYVIYTLYTIFIILVSDYNLSYAIAGLSCMWLCFFIYKCGVTTKTIKVKYKHETAATNEKQTKFPLSNIGHWNNTKYLVAAIISILSTLMATKYYTGKGLTQVLASIGGSNDSSYYVYQKYFIENNIGTFSLVKIPYILMLAIVVILMIWSYLGIILENNKIKLAQILFILVTTVSYIYFGLARGTNFEFFIIFIVVTYCILYKMQTAQKKYKKRYILAILIIAILIVTIFRIVVSSRGVKFENNLTRDIHYDATAVISVLFPTITNIATSLFGYIGFGIYAIGVSLLDIVLYTPINILLSLTPFGYNLFSEQPLTQQLGAEIEIGVRWFPDFVNAIGIFGIPIFIIVLYLIGRITNKVINANYPPLLKNTLNVLVFIEMISIPIGNFLLTSSSNILMLLFIIIWLFIYRKNQINNRPKIGKEND